MMTAGAALTVIGKGSESLVGVGRPAGPAGFWANAVAHATIVARPTAAATEAFGFGGTLHTASAERPVAAVAV